MNAPAMDDNWRFVASNACAHIVNESQQGAHVSLTACQLRAALLGPSSEVQLRYHAFHANRALEKWGNNNGEITEIFV